MHRCGSTSTAANTPAKPAAPAGPVDTKKTISAVDAKANTISIQYLSNKKIVVYKVDDFTTIRVNGNLAKLADVKTGMVVSESSERDTQTLDRIFCGGRRRHSGSTEEIMPRSG